MRIEKKLEQVRSLMKDRCLGCVIIPSSDAHLSEYPAECYKLREYLSGFTGSEGVLIVGEKRAVLLVDSRYYIQAEQQTIATDIHTAPIDKDGTRNQIISSWAMKLCCMMPIGLFANVTSYADAEEIMLTCEEKGYSVRQLRSEVYEQFWLGERPAFSPSKIFIHDVKYAGESAKSKISRLRMLMQERGVKGLLISKLEDVAWLLNLRGSDLPDTPVFYSYLLVCPRKVILYVRKEAMTPEVEEYLESFGVVVDSYENHLKFKRSDVISFEPHSSAAEVEDKGNNFPYAGPDIVANMRLIKNETQVSGIRNAMLKDCVALVRMLKWLEENKGKGIFETDIADKMIEYRSQMPDYKCESFDTIAGYADHGAIVHYHAVKGMDYDLKSENIVLIDTGGNYFDGTTDITRTVSLGAVTPQQKHDYTLVLKGHIDLAIARFPNRMTSKMVDVIARKPLAMECLGYGHGTGHGVGHFLCVHEGPLSFSSDVKLEENMIITDEPGLYREGHHGIRIENMVRVKKIKENEFGTFLGFEVLTLCPYDYDLIDYSLLDKDELLYLEEYTLRVVSEMERFAQLTPEEMNWLRTKCENGMEKILTASQGMR